MFFSISCCIYLSSSHKFVSSCIGSFPVAQIHSHPFHIHIDQTNQKLCISGKPIQKYIPKAWSSKWFYTLEVVYNILKSYPGLVVNWILQLFRIQHQVTLNFPLPEIIANWIDKLQGVRALYVCVYLKYGSDRDFFVIRPRQVKDINTMLDLFHLFFFPITHQRPSEERGLNEQNLKRVLFCNVISNLKRSWMKGLSRNLFDTRPLSISLTTSYRSYSCAPVVIRCQ